MLDEQPHQSLGVEDELVATGLLVPAGPKVERERAERERAGPPSPGGSSPDDGVHASHLRRALQDAQRLGQGVALVCRGQRSPGDKPMGNTEEGGLLPELSLPTGRLCTSLWGERMGQAQQEVERA